MTPWTEQLCRWLIDYYALATILLAAVLLGGAALKQPARWIPLAWAATAGLLGLAVVTALQVFVPVVIPVFVSPLFELPTALPNQRLTDAEATGESDLESVVLEHRSIRNVPPLIDTPIRRVRPFRRVRPDVLPIPDQPDVIDAVEHAEPPLEPARPLVSMLPSEKPAGQKQYSGHGARIAIAYVFLVVASLVLAWQILGAVFTIRLQRRSRPAVESIQHTLHEVWQGRRLPPLVFVTDAVNQALATGVFKPVILLPEWFVLQESQDSLQAVLAHEASHVMHRDLWLRAQQRLLMLILFAHPLFWLLRSMTHANQEYLADATARGEQPLDYAEILLHWFRTGAADRNRFLTASVGLWERPHLLKRRISMVLNETFSVERSCTPLWRITVWSVISMCVLALSCITLHGPSEAMAQEGKKKSKGKVAKAKESVPVEVKVEDDQLKFTDDQVAKAKAKYSSAEEAFGVGAAHYNSQKFAASREPFEAAVILGQDPGERLKVYRALMASYRLLGTSEQFVTVSEYVIRHSERDAEQSLTRNSLLSFLHERGKVEPFIKRHEERLKKNPKDRLSLYVLSEVYTRLSENPARSIEILKQLAEVDGTTVDKSVTVNANAKLAAQYIRAKEYQKGAELYEKIAPQDEKLAAWHWKEAATAWLKLKQHDKALAAAKKSVESAPEKRAEALTHFWHRHLGDVFLAVGEPKLAIPQYEKAIETTKIEGYLKDCTASLAEAKMKAGE